MKKTNKQTNKQKTSSSLSKVSINGNHRTMKVIYLQWVWSVRRLLFNHVAKRNLTGTITVLIFLLLSASNTVKERV